MKLIIDLQDHDGKSHKAVKIELQNQATINQLQDKIRSIFQIEAENQQIFHNERRIDLLSGTLEEALIAHNYTLVLKHAMLGNLANCLTIIENLKKRKPEHLKSKLVKEGSQYLQLLENAKFFIAYTDFFNTFIELNEQFDRYVIGIEEKIKLAVKSYFKNYFHNEELNVNFIPKPDTGAQGGFICQVMGEEFFVKNHTFMGRGSNHSRIDLRELFVYRLLHLIGVGAEPHFIPSAYSKFYSSALALHIATKRIPGFQRRANRATCNFTTNHQIELDLIKNMLYLTDLNSGNFGLDEKQQLAVVDFVVKQPKDCIHCATFLNQFFEDHVCCEVWKETLRNWNMLENVNKAKNFIMDDCKRLNTIIWREGYEEYLETVFKNITLLNKLLS